MSTPANEMDFGEKWKKKKLFKNKTIIVNKIANEGCH